MDASIGRGFRRGTVGWIPVRRKGGQQNFSISLPFGDEVCAGTAFVCVCMCVYAAWEVLMEGGGETKRSRGVGNTGIGVEWDFKGHGNNPLR